jgi:hypothetical protein
VAALSKQAEHTRSTVQATDLAARRRARADPASLERVLFHLLQECARHLGQLDIVTELAGGPMGE